VHIPRTCRAGKHFFPTELVDNRLDPGVLTSRAPEMVYRVLIIFRILFVDMLGITGLIFRLSVSNVTVV